MGRKNFAVVDLIELFAQWETGRSQVQISESLGWDRKRSGSTSRQPSPRAWYRVVRPAGEAVWVRRITAWFPRLSDDRSRKVTWPAIEVHRNYIEEQLKAGTAVSTISSRLNTEKGLTVSRASLRRWIAANLPEEAVRPRRATPHAAR